MLIHTLKQFKGLSKTPAQFTTLLTLFRGLDTRHMFSSAGKASSFSFALQQLLQCFPAPGTLARFHLPSTYH